jgi:hypothetical protein
MTAYLSRGDKVILYAGNLNIGALSALMKTLHDEGVEVFPPLLPGDEPAGPPCVLAVIEEPQKNCEVCGWPSEILAASHDAGGGRGDCPRTEPHHPHTWSNVDFVGYCKGVS